MHTELRYFIFLLFLEIYSFWYIEFIAVSFFFRFLRQFRQNGRVMQGVPGHRVLRRGCVCLCVSGGGGGGGGCAGGDEEVDEGGREGEGCGGEGFGVCDAVIGGERI